MRIQMCSNKGAGPIRGKMRKILINLEKSSSHEPIAREMLKNFLFKNH